MPFTITARTAQGPVTLREHSATAAWETLRRMEIARLKGIEIFERGEKRSRIELRDGLAPEKQLANIR